MLEQGKYNIVGSLLDETNQKELDALRDGFGEENFNKLTFLSADMSEPETVKKLVETSNCQYIIHLASPFHLQEPENEDEFLKPAVTGTTTILEAALNNGVKRVVVTSS